MFDGLDGVWLCFGAHLAKSLKEITSRTITRPYQHGVFVEGTGELERDLVTPASGGFWWLLVTRTGLLFASILYRVIRWTRATGGVITSARQFCGSA